MQITLSILENGVKLILLNGRLDMQGTGEIELKFTAYAATQKAGVVVDLSQVSFLASIGIRLLLTSARAVQQRGGKMALLNPISSVADVLAISGIRTIIPVFYNLDEACTEVQSGVRS